LPGGTGENTPFAGSYVPLRHWQREPLVSSAMVEARRDLYMGEPGGPIHDGYNALAECLSRLLAAAAGPPPSP
jgi:hypothetical protein